MTLTNKAFVKIAEATQGFATYNKSKLKNSIVLIVISTDGSTPDYTDETVLENSIEMDIVNNNGITRGNLPVGAIYAAPKNEVVKIGIQVWDE